MATVEAGVIQQLPAREQNARVIGLGADACAFPSNLVQLPLQSQDPQVAQVIFQKLPVIKCHRLLERKILVDHEIMNFAFQDVAGRCHKGLPLS